MCNFSKKAFGSAILKRNRKHWRIQGGAPGTRAPPPLGSKFFHFHAVFGKNVKNNSNFGSWRPPWGKSWIRHWKVTLFITLYLFSKLLKLVTLLSHTQKNSFQFTLGEGWSLQISTGNLIGISSIFIISKRSLGQCNIFTPVCHSVHRGGSVSVHAGLPPYPPRTSHTTPSTKPPWNRHTTHPCEQAPPSPTTRQIIHPRTMQPPGTCNPPGP